jgi:uncharacterized damage-inducible protein DinB
MRTPTLAREFLDHARTKLTEYMAQIARCTQLLSPDEMWQRDNEHTNSVGNLVLHLTGNVRQWIVAGLGAEPLVRSRPAEFAERGPLPTDEIVAALAQAVARAEDILARLEPSAVEARYTIQGYEVSGLIAVFHVVEHFAGHTGQIVHITKALKNVDLSLYDAEGQRRPGSGVVP